MSLETITDRLKQKIALAPHFGAKVKFDFGADGILYVDATQKPPHISHDDLDADVTFLCSAATFGKILDGAQDPTMAYMTGKLKIRGAMGLAMKLNAMLED